MNTTIKRLNDELKKIQNEASAIESELQEAWGLVFQDIKPIHDAICALESSSEYAWDKFGEIILWARFDLTPYRDSRQYFETYMQESHHVTIDWKNDTISLNIGPSIIINDSGSVYDQERQKVFITKDDYRNEDGELDKSKRNELIEAHMEDSGYFPGVYETDCHGNIKSVSTVKKA